MKTSINYKNIKETFKLEVVDTEDFVWEEPTGETTGETTEGEAPEPLEIPTERIVVMTKVVEPVDPKLFAGIFQARCKLQIKEITEEECLEVYKAFGEGYAEFCTYRGMQGCTDFGYVWKGNGDDITQIYTEYCEILKEYSKLFKEATDAYKAAVTTAFYQDTTPGCNTFSGSKTCETCGDELARKAGFVMKRAVNLARNFNYVLELHKIKA